MRLVASSIAVALLLGSAASGAQASEAPLVIPGPEPRDGTPAPETSAEPIAAEYEADPLVPRLYGGLAFGVGAPGGAGIFGGVAPTRAVSFEWFTGGGNFGFALALGTRLTPLRTTYVDASFAFLSSLSFDSQDDERRYPTTSRWTSAEVAVDFRLFEHGLDLAAPETSSDQRLGQRLRLAGGWTVLGNWRDYAAFDECPALGICEFGPGNGGFTPRDARENSLAGEGTTLPYLRLDWYAYFDL
ncbi:MAG: hypothetical protein JRI68_15425 [Deltaproteobacteria bacterium]|nr:hypothetical protein [Deltaproteobacteria bacterium]